MDYLKLAQEYACQHGDDNWFCNLYTGFRAYNNVTDSVWKTLSYLYGNDLADQLQKQNSVI